MSRDTQFQLGLIGHPLSHSLSPLLHQTALEAAGLSGAYRLWEIPPAQFARQIQPLINGLRSKKINGINVTIPYKQRIITYLDRLTEAGQIVGAVNTLYLSQGKLVGDNTDILGFQSSIRGYTFSAGPKNALVLGSGGAARAVIYSLLQDSWQVICAARNASTQKQIQADFQRLSAPGGLTSISMDRTALQSISADLQLVVNATPLGMTPDTPSSPWPTDLPFPAQAVCFDLVYNPPTTRLMAYAREYGARVLNGQMMLVEQAAAAFERWTGIKPAVSEMAHRLTEQLQSRP